jgi:hypothetical protein
MSAASASSFAAGYAAALARVGWRAALHILPYALLAGIMTEMVLRLRAPVVWKLPLVVGVLACLHVAVMLAAHVAALRRAARLGLPVPPARQHLLAAGRISREAFVLLALVVIAGLAAIGLIEQAAGLTEEGFAQRWPWTLARGVGTLSALAVMTILLAAATAFAACSSGRTMSLGQASRALHLKSPRTAAVILLVIALGTASTVAGFVVAQLAGLWPVAMAGGAAKALGYLAAATALGIGASELAAEPGA